MYKCMETKLLRLCVQRAVTVTKLTSCDCYQQAFLIKTELAVKLTSVRMMSAAPLAAAVAPATAMPTLAFFKAGASFTPSPAMGVSQSAYMSTWVNALFRLFLQAMKPK